MRFGAWPLLVLMLAPTITAAPTGAVVVDRVPGGGVQPEIVIDDRGVLHMVYLAGDPAKADVFYVKSVDEGRTFSAPRRVNSQAGSAIAIGTVRGAQLAIGRRGRIHVVWNGSAGMPLLYSRSDDQQRGFEPARDLMTQTTTLDGGASIAADPRGNVYVAWHANRTGEQGEVNRRVWLARSTTDGRSFGIETAISDPATGACGCCAVRAGVSPTGEIRVLYRAAANNVHRDMYDLVSRDGGRTFTGALRDRWEIAACPMTTASIVGRRQAWETDGQVFWSAPTLATPAAPPSDATGAPRRKHPRLAVARNGTLLLAWAQGTAWARGGAVGWQLFDKDGRPIGAPGLQQGLPVWSFPAAVARRDGTFAVFY